jgi:alkylated DNA repair protein alkB family protein 1
MIHRMRIATLFLNASEINKAILMSATSENLDLFTPVFKHFRRLSDIDCFTQAYSITNHPSVFQHCPLTISTDIHPSLGLQPISTWSLYSCKFSDGLYLLSNPFTSVGQRQWIDRCLNIYARQTKTSVGDNSDNQNLTRIRWATLGYHYDWTNKIYKQDDHTKMPDELALLCQTIMHIISSNTGTKKYGLHK